MSNEIKNPDTDKPATAGKSEDTLFALNKTKSENENTPNQRAFDKDATLSDIETNPARDGNIISNAHMGTQIEQAPTIPNSIHHDIISGINPSEIKPDEPNLNSDTYVPGSPSPQYSPLTQNNLGLASDQHTTQTVGAYDQLFGIQQPTAPADHSGLPPEHTNTSNAQGAAVGTLSVADPDAGDTHTYAVSDDRFEVVDGTLKLKGGTHLDHEAAASIDVTVTATDAGGLTSEQTFTLAVEDVNEAPGTLDLSHASVAENAPGAAIGTLSVVDPDAGDTHTYAVSDDRFEVVDGTLKLKSGTHLDHEAAASIDVTVTATDAGGLTSEQTFTLAVEDVNEAPGTLDLSHASVAENAPGAVVGTLSVVDPDAGDTHTYAVSDDRFEVVDGTLKLKSGTHLDHEAAASIDVTVTATDAGGLTSEQTFTLAVEDINEAPGTLDLSHASVAENAPGAAVGTLSVADPDAGDTHTYAVSDDRFEVVDGTLKLKGGTHLDHEAAASIDVTVTATDAGGLTSEQTFTLAVEDVNEAPGTLDLSHASVAENAPGAAIGTLSVVDPDAGDTHTYAVSDDRFEVVDGTLKLKSGTHLDHEAAASIDVTVTATDAGGLTSEQTFTLAVEDVNEAPGTLDLSHASVAENAPGAAIGTLSVADPDAGDTHTYAVSDDRFEVVDGTLKLKGGTHLDHEAAASIDVTVTATDAGGLTSEQTFTLAVEDVNEAPGTLDLSHASVAENAPGAAVGTLSVVDPDAGDTHTYAVSDDRFEVVDGTLKLKSDTHLDHEAAASIDVTVTATDAGGLTSEQTFTLAVEDVNEAPGTLDLSHASVAENAPGAAVGTLSVVDPDAGDTHTYAVSDDRFEVVDGTLKLKSGTHLDHEAAASIDVTVTATDAGGLTSEQTFTLAVEDVNEAPGTLDLSHASVAENAPGAAIGTLSVVDPDAGDTHTYAVSDDRFEVVDGTLKLKSGTHLDHEAAASIDVTVTATDAGGLTSEQTFTLAVEDVNEAPGTLDLSHASVAENAPGAAVGTLSVADPDAGDTHTYAVSDDRFEVVDGTLKLKSGTHLDHEAAASIDVTVTATDAGGLTSEQTFTLAVEDINEAPGTLDLSHASVAENAPGAAVGTLSVVDPDAGDTHTYAVSDDRFEVVDGTLKLKSDTHLDHEAAASIDVTVTATDAGGLTSEQTFTLAVEDVNEAPGTLDLSHASVAENAPGAAVGTLSVVDPDAGDTHTYAVSDDRFEVVDGTLKLKSGTHLDHEAAASIDVTVTATDAGGLTSEQTFTLAVEDVNEAPGTLDLSHASVAENAPGAAIGTLSVVDPDAGDTHTYAVSDDRFEVVDGTLKLKSGTHLDHETAASIDVTVTATDAGGLTSEQTFTLAVEDVNEAPGTLDLSHASVAENAPGAAVGTLSVADPDAGDTHTYAVSDDRFEVVDGTLKLKSGTHLDHETAASIDVTVTATDAGGLTSEQTFTLAVEDVNEAPGTLDLSHASVAENAPGAAIGTLSVVDPDAGDTHTYAVSDDRFEVVDGTLKLKSGTHLDHEAAASIDVTVTATDAGGLTSEQTFTLAVEDVNEAPGTLDLSHASVAENAPGAAVGTLSVADPDAGDTHTYAVSDDRFEVVDGTLKLKGGTHLDHEAAASIDVTVTATDAGGLTSEQTFTLAVEDVNEAPGTLDLSHASVAENTPGAVVGTLSVVDPDAGDTHTYAVSDDRFEVVDGTLKLKSGTHLDHEAAASIDVTVTATDAGGLTSEQTFTLAVEDVNEAPGTLDLSHASVAENAPGAAIGTLSVADPDAGDTHTYAVSDDRFEVVDGTLKLKGGTHLDHEAAASIDVTVTATDAGGLTSEQTFTLAVEDVNEAPGTLDLSHASVAENAPGAAIGTLSVVDPDAGDTHTYAVSDDRFEVVDGTLKLKGGTHLDHETAASIDVTVTATDAGGLTSEQTFTLAVEDVNEAPGTLDLSHASVAENAPGAAIGTLSVVDPDAGDTHTYAVSDDRFEVVDGTLKLKSGTHLDHEAAASIDVTVTATDAGGLTSEQTFTLAVEDVNEAPGTLDLSHASVAENAPGAAVGTLSVVDPDAGDTHTYAVSDDRFEVVDGTLKLKSGTHLDHEAAASIDVTVTATDAGGLTSEQTFTLAVEDINEAPGTLDLSHASVAENAPGAAVGTLSVADPDAGDTHTYAVSDDRFEVVDGTLKLKGGTHLDHEAAASIDVTVTATDAGGLTSEQTFTLAVEDVNEAPGTLDLSHASVAENAPGAAIGTLSVVDPDAGDTHTYAVSDDRFEVVDGTLKLKSGTHLDHEAAASIDVTVTATDAGGLTSEQTFTLAVEDVNEAPGTLDLSHASVAENAPGAAIGTLSVADPDAGDTHTYAVSDDRFEVVDGTLKLKSGTHLDHEAAASIDVTVTATDAGGLTSEQTFTLAVEDVNKAPDAIQISFDPPNLVQNGSFEDRAASWKTSASLEIWRTETASDGEMMLELDWRGEAHGAHVLDSIQQTISTEEGKVYDLSLDVRTRNPAGQTESIEIYWNGEKVGETEAASPSWEPRAFQVTGTGGDDVLEFREAADENDGNGSHIDNIVLKEAPIALDLSHVSVAENAPGAAIGTLSVVDPDAGDTHTYAVSDDRFVVVDGTLKLKDGTSLDHEAAASIDVTVTATDAGGLSSEQTLTLAVEDVNEAPDAIQISFDPPNLVQNGSFEDRAASWKTSASLEIWRTEAAPDGEMMLELDWRGEAHGAHVLDSIQQTISTEEGKVYDLSLDVRTSNPAGRTESIEIYWNGEKVGETEATSPSWESREFQVTGTGGDDVLEFREAADENDGNGSHIDNIVLKEAPIALDLSHASVAENAQGAVVGTLSVANPDAGDTHTYAVSDDRFEVVDGTLKLKDGTSLDHEAAASIDVTVTATDAGGLTSEQTLTLAVEDVPEHVQLGAGDDTFNNPHTGDKVDIIDGGAGNDEIWTGGGDDIISGGSGDDRLFGEAGNDLFLFQAGNGDTDTVTGGAGWIDTIELQSGDGGVLDVDWTLQLEAGSIETSGSDFYDLSEDAQGTITFTDGSQVDFWQLERIEW